MGKKIKVVDLTYPIEEGMLTFDCSWHPKVSIQQLGRIGQEGRESRSVTLGSHTGTHIDAPLHFIKNGGTIDQVPLEKLIGPVSIFDFSSLQEEESVTLRMIQKLKLTTRIIFKFGWGRHWGFKKYYHNYPYFQNDAAEFLVRKRVQVIGFDTPSPDDSRIQMGSQEDSQVHKIFLSNKVVLIEYLANLNQVKDYHGWNLIALPLRIKDSDGSPARVCIFR